MTALVIVEAVVIALLVVLVAGLLRSHAEILQRLHALDGGEAEGGRTEGLQVARRSTAAVPEAVAGPTPSGASTSIPLRDSRGMVLLAFLSSGCSTCRPFWEALGTADMPGPGVRPVIVTKSPTEESPAKIEALAPPEVPTIMSSEGWDAFRIPVSPYFVLIDAAGGTLVGEGAAGSWEHVRDLLASAMADAGLGGHDTTARSTRADNRLRSAGVEPGDPSLYRNPHDHR